MASIDPLEQLSRVLALEAQCGHRNDAVIGGLEEFAAQWHLQAASYVKDKESARRLAEIAQMLMDYPLLPQAARPSTIRHLQASVAELRKSGVGGRKSEATDERRRK